MTPVSVLVIDDEPRMRAGLGKLLAGEGYRVHLAGGGEEALRLLREQPVRVVLTDFRMPGLDGLGVLRHVKDVGIDAEVVLLTGHGSIDLAVQAIKEGAYDFLTKPPDTERLLHVIRRAAERQAMVRRAQVLEAGQAPTRALIAESPGMRAVLDLVARVAPSDATVLILGESGTGKELVARALHSASRRRAQPLVAVNCAAIPDALLESELFGHERGAFTGAARRKPGRFELADGGTLFLDEIGELAPATQAKLLRALQEREIERLGGTAPVPVDVRVVAATNQDLPRLVAERRFREDLYYRLNVITVELPPLRRRPEDLLPLAEHFLRLHARRLGKSMTGFAPKALAQLCLYPWPGNVRELEHAVERAVILARGDAITPGDLLLRAPASPAVDTSRETGTLADVERECILAAVERCGGNQREAARALAIDRSTLHRKLRLYGVGASQ